MPSEFKISRLIFNWEGPWVTGTTYKRDTIIQYEGKTYVCLEPHTASSNFYDDLNVPITPYWTLMVDGRAWKQEWQPNTFYSVGNIVNYGGVVYICTIPHTSGSTEISIANWDTFARFGRWANQWQTSTVYGVDDYVRYGGIVYRCVEGHISAATESEGLEFDYEGSAPKWEIINDGVDYKGTWSSANIRYKRNDLVVFGTNVLKCIVPHTSTTSFDDLNWEVWLPGLEFVTTWDDTTTYDLNDTVIYGGYSYVSRVNNNLNIVPSTNVGDSTSAWELLTKGYDIKDNWTSTINYRVGDIVKKGGQTFVAIKDSYNQDPTNITVVKNYELVGSSGTTLKVIAPDSAINNIVPGMILISDNFNRGQTVVSYNPAIETIILNEGPDGTPYGGEELTFVGVDYEYWNLLVPSVNWRGFWDDGISYTIGDLVVYQNFTYRCIQDHTSQPTGQLVGGNNPKDDTSRTYWVIYSEHDKNNALKTFGDILYRDETSNVPLPINAVEITVGTTTFDVTNALASSYIINYQSDPTLNLIRGQTYTFNVNANGHPFWIKTAQTTGDTNDIYNDGVTNNGAQIGTITFTVPWDAPNTLYYICQYHSAMVGTINIGETTSSESKILKIKNSIPSWENAFQTPNVFYVATTGFDGEDYADRGRTWDHPFKTINHACEVVAAGSQYHLTKAALVNNKAWMLEEMWQWMEYQKDNSISPYSPTSEYDETKTRRDASYVIDAICYDITRGGNSQTVAAISAYFEYGSTNTFINADVAAKMPFFIPALEYLLTLINYVLDNVDPTVNYQDENGIAVESQLTRTPGYVLETNADNIIDSLANLVINALTNQSTADLPPPNDGLTATIFVKSGTYPETLPIVVPANCAIVGDELRGTVVQPNIVIATYATSTDGGSETIQVLSTEGMYDGCPVQFVSTGEVLDDFPNLTIGQTYYVIGDSITESEFSVSLTVGGAAVNLSTDTGNMYVYGGDAIKDMFYLRDSTGLRNMTVTGLLGTLTAENAYGTRRPTGGAYASLDPGLGPDDTSAWIYRRSPYVQNVTTFGYGCVGMKIDGTLHNGGNKSIVANDFTQVLSDGIGVWCTGKDSLTECVSVFTYYNYASYFAEDGGRIRATNGNSSYGTFGVIAEGYDDSETPISGNIDNRSTQASATVQSSFGINSELLRLQYSNAGSAYNTAVTNMLEYSNDFVTGWTSDGNVNITQGNLSPTGHGDGWNLNGTTSSTDSSYLYQTITVAAPGAVYTNLGANNVSGSGVSALFDVTVGATSYSVTVANGGSGYVATNQMVIYGSTLGGRDGTNDLTITVDTLSGSSIQTVIVSGTVPSGSDLKYTVSVHAKQGSSDAFDLYALFSGTSNRVSAVTYNFTTDTVTPYNETSGLLPTLYGREVLENGWYRVWFNFYDTNALNTSLQIRIYPRTKTGTAGNTLFFGTQLELSTTSPRFYLESMNDRYTAYADYHVRGAGTGAQLVGDETRSNSVYQIRVIDEGLGAGGRGYLTSLNNAQGGDGHYIILSQAEINEPSNLERMRLFIISGTGAGQYGYIGNYNSFNKYAYMLKESFTPIVIASADDLTNSFTLDPSTNTKHMYENMPVQFIPTYYETEVTGASQDSQAVTSTVGGLVNTITVTDTTRLTLWMPINFSGTVFGGVITDFTYYVSSIIDSTTIQISSTLYGSTLFLNTASGSMNLLFPANNNYFTADSTADMEINMAVQFTGVAIGGITVGSTYYISDIIDANNFTISNSLINVTATGTSASGNTITVSSSSNLVPLNPIVFEGSGFGNLVAGTTYYISNKPGVSTFTVTTTLLTTTVTATTATSNLVTVDDTTGFVPNNPIKFVGTTFGNIVSGTIYYILAVNNSTTFTISTSIGGSALTLTTAVGECMAKTTPADLILSNASGTLNGTSTSAVRELVSSSGSMTATFFTKIFGGIQAGVDYYVLDITPSLVPYEGDTFRITATSGGVAPVSLTPATGSMQMGEVGWDHVNIGSPVEPILDSTTQYFIEARPQFSDPTFSQVSTTPISLAPGTSYIDVAYGENLWIAIPDDNATAMSSTNGTTWTTMTLPITSTFKSIAYGNKNWVIITSSNVVGETGSRVLYSNSDGLSWRVGYLPSKTTWSKVAYGNGVFVAIATGTATAAYSLNHGKTWSSATGLPNATWTDIAFGDGRFVAVASGGTQAAYSLDGQTWVSSTLPVSTTWTSIAYGKGRFVAVSNGDTVTAYTFNGSTWYTSNIAITADLIAYGQGVFLALDANSTTAYTSEGGITWTERTVSNDYYDAVAFGFQASTYNGVFVTVAGASTSSNIVAGCLPKGRVTVTSSSVTEINMWETGSGYTGSSPTITITDPNITIPVVVTPRIGNGVLSGPTFISRGTGYNTNSTVLRITGDGYADEYQTGLSIVCNNVSKLPAPGDNLVINGNTVVYKVTNATILDGTTVPNLKVSVSISPEMTVELSPDHNESITIRQKYSQARLTNHDYLNIGFGNFVQSNYPGLPTETELASQNQAIENNYGRVFYTSTDQDGNFKVGNLFGVEQATGIVTLSASQFGLSGLNQLTLGGIAVGGSSVVITQFSTDPTFIANSNSIIPTQKAIKSYITGRLTQGGSNTFTGQLTAGTVIVGATNNIDNTIPQGIAGSSVNMLNKVNIAGANAAISGNMEALFFFSKQFFRKSSGV